MEETLAKSKLLDYLGKVKNLEISCYQQEIIVNGLKNELNQLLADQKYWSNQLSQSAPQKPGLSIGSLLLHLLLLPLSLVVGCIVGYILFYGVCLILFIPSLFFKPLNKFTNHIGVGCVLLCAIICAGVVIVSLIQKIKNPKQEYQADKVKYDEAQCTAESQIAILNQKVSTLKAAAYQADRKLYETKNIRQSLYNMDYLYKKYQGLIPVCTII